MRKVAALVLVFLLNFSLVAAALPLGGGDAPVVPSTSSGGSAPTPGVSGPGSQSGVPAGPAQAVGGQAVGGQAVDGQAAGAAPSSGGGSAYSPSPLALPAENEFKGPLPAVTAPAPFVPPASRSAIGSDTQVGAARTDQDPAPWWFGSLLAPRPQTVNVTSDTSIILFVRDGPSTGGPMVQVPTDADLAAGASPIAFANNTTSAFYFTGKLFETTVGNKSVNASSDLDLGVANQTLLLSFDGANLSVGSDVVTGNASSSIPPPFHYANGSFSFSVPRFPDNGCGGHVFRVEYNNQYLNNNYSYYSSSARDFRVYTTCDTTLSIAVDQNPIVVGDNATFYGSLTGSKAEAVGGRPIQIVMDGGLLGLTGPGAFFDDVAVTGTTFSDDFEDLNNSHWNQSGQGVGTWTVGQLSRPECQPIAAPTDPTCPGPAIPGTGYNMAGTGLSGYYGKGVDTWLISPAIDLSGNVTAPQLTFWYWYSIAYDDLFEVAFSTDNGRTWVNHTDLREDVATSGLINSVGGTIAPALWNSKGIPLSYFVGAPALLIAFHLLSVDHTAITTGAGSFSFRFQIPFDTKPLTHNIKAQFAKGIQIDADGVTVITDPTWDLSYQFTVSIETIRLWVRRLAHFSFNLTADEKIGFRSDSLTIAGNLFDNQNEALVSDPDNPLERIDVHIEWDLDYGDPTDTPTVIVDKLEVDSTGAFSYNYVVSTLQPLGLHNVTFTFLGAKYYTNTTGLDVYRLMGHTYVIWPPEDARKVTRFTNATVMGEIHVLPNESRFNSQFGDFVDGEQVSLVWDTQGDNTPIPEGQGRVTTNNTGVFLATKFVPFDAVLGKKTVSLTYAGSDVYKPLQSNINWSVVSIVQILFENTSAYKGSLLWLNGTVLDDRGVGIDKLTLQVFLDNEEVAPTTTESDGSYSVPHFVPTGSAVTVGNKSVIVRFNGNPIYLANNTTSLVAIKAHTLIERTDHTQVIDRGKQLNVTAKMVEVYEGDVRGAGIEKEGIAIRILDQTLTIQFSNSNGEVQFRSNVPAALPWGESVLAFEYNGSEFYDAARNETPIVIRGQAFVVFLPATFTLNGGPFNLSADTVHQQDELAGKLQITDELGAPLATGDVRLGYSKQQNSATTTREIFPISTGPIDEVGRYEFNVTWDDISPGNRTLIGNYNGTFCPTFISPRTLCVRAAEGNITVKYERLEPPAPAPDNTLLYVVVSAAGVILASAFYFFWYAAKRRQLQKMQRIIRRAADRLVAGNPYAQVIFDAYRALARFLQANGYLRKDSETFREFEVALRQALPIDAQSMDEFLSILEEARYSDHEIGEAQKDRALASLNAVKTSIEQVMLTGQGALAPAAQGARPPSPPAAESGEPPLAPPPT